MTKIEWVKNPDGSHGQTWNPVVGCSIVSPGCINCYAMKMAGRIEAMNAGIRPGHAMASHYNGTTKRVNGRSVWTGLLAQASEDTLLAPLRRKKPTTYFVNSMGDLFHEDVPDEWIDQVLAVGALCPQHTLQILTKRAARMHAYMTAPGRKQFIAERAMDLSNMLAARGGHQARIKLDHFSACFAGPSGPFKNIWLGVSTERQKEADERIPILLQTPAAIRFISAEPLLEQIDLSAVLARLDWVIVGGESGQGSRPMKPIWARFLQQQCEIAGVPFFFKQWGDWAHDDAGKKLTGRLLDGLEYSAMPERCQRERMAP